MALALDGYQVLRRIGKNPDCFPDIATEVNKAARTLLTKQIKAKTAGLKAVRDIRKALGGEAFSIFVDGMSDAEVKSTLTKLDKHHPDLKKSNAQWRRDQLRGLADGDIEPTEKVVAPKKGKSTAKSSKTAKKTSPEELPLLGSEAMAAVRRRN